jgi:hypothetical protein
MFKIFMTENNTTVEEIQMIINDLINNESDSSITSVILNTVNTYTSDCLYYNFGNNVLFQYYDIGVNVCIKQEDDIPYTHYLFGIN